MTRAKRPAGVPRDLKARSRKSIEMSRVRNKGTYCERIVEQFLSDQKIEFTTHAKSLPGRPDFVMGQCRIAIFVHGCFWHQHKGCKKSSRPKTNVAFWNRKLDLNAIRDKQNLKAIRLLGWTPLVVWECQLKSNPLAVRKKLLFSIEKQLRV